MRDLPARPCPDTISVTVLDWDGSFILTNVPPLVVPDPKGREVTYHPWVGSNGEVGYRITRDDAKVEYLYFNPSNNDDGSDDPNVFVYSGLHGDPSRDGSHVHFVQRFGEESEDDA